MLNEKTDTEILEPTSKIGEAERASIHTLIEHVWGMAKQSQQVIPNGATKDAAIDFWLGNCPLWMQSGPGSLPVTSSQLEETALETLVEQDRVKTLSNADLVNELSQCEIVWQYEIMLDEAMFRLDPHFWERKAMRVPEDN